MLSWVQAAATIVLGVGSVFWSRQASARSKATSNGFAEDVTRSLERIENKIDGHVRDHWFHKGGK